ncbi:MAG: hypothetical protein AB7I30_13800, partial [Isosphaeraceae bacterium]
MRANPRSRDSGRDDRLDEARRRAFETAWLEGQPRPIVEFLPPVDDDRRGATLEELVQIELEFAWKRNATLDAEGLSGAP